MYNCPTAKQKKRKCNFFDRDLWGSGVGRPASLVASVSLGVAGLPLFAEPCIKETRPFVRQSRAGRCGLCTAAPSEDGLALCCADARRRLVLVRPSLRKAHCGQRADQAASIHFAGVPLGRSDCGTHHAAAERRQLKGGRAWRTDRPTAHASGAAGRIPGGAHTKHSLPCGRLQRGGRHATLDWVQRRAVT